MIGNSLGDFEICGLFNAALVFLAAGGVAGAQIGVWQVRADGDRRLTLAIAGRSGFFDSIGGTHHLAVRIIFFGLRRYPIEVHRQ